MQRLDFCRRYKSLIMILLVSLIFGCGPGSEDGPGNSTSTQPDLKTSENASSTMTEFAQTWAGGNSGVQNQQQRVVRTLEEWKSVWGLAHQNQEPVPELPPLDFENQMVIAVFMGSRNTGGYSISITEISKKGDGLKVAVLEESPPEDSVNTQALTSPYQMVVAPKVAGEIEFTQQK